MMQPVLQNEPDVWWPGPDKGLRCISDQLTQAWFERSADAASKLEEPNAPAGVRESRGGPRARDDTHREIRAVRTAARIMHRADLVWSASPGKTRNGGET